MLVGRLFCRACHARTIHETEEEVVADPSYCSLFCTHCDNEIAPSLQECDAAGAPFPGGVRRVPVYTKAQLEAATRELHEGWRTDAIRNGVSIEKLQYPHRRTAE